MALAAPLKEPVRPSIPPDTVLTDPFAEGLVEIKRRATDVGLSSRQISAVIGLHFFQQFMTSCAVGAGDRNGPGTNPQEVKSFLKKLGYMPSGRKVITDALRGEALDEKTYGKLRAELTWGSDDGAELLEMKPQEICRKHPELSLPRAKVLQHFLKHQIEVDDNISARLLEVFPLPISPNNYFGRFIAGGCDNPRKAVRHMQLAVPFFTQIRSMLESLSAKKHRFLVVGQGEPPAKSLQGEDWDPIAMDDQHEIIHQCVNKAQDFTLGGDSRIDPRLACIPLPNFSRISLDHLREPELLKFAGELYDYLFYGDASGELLNRPIFSLKEKARLKKTLETLAKVRQQARNHKKKKPKASGGERALDRWEDRQESFKSKIENLIKSIKELRSRKNKAKSVKQFLTQDTTFRRETAVFRKNIAEAEAAGRRIVFSSIDFIANAIGPFPFYTVLEKAFYSRNPHKSRGIALLQSASFILSPDSSLQAAARKKKGNSLKEDQIRFFSFDTEEINPSVHRVLGEVLPQRGDPEISKFRMALVLQLDMPGIHNEKALETSVKAATRKLRPKAEDYLVYALEHVSSIEDNQLFDMLAAAMGSGVRTLPNRAKQLIVRKFHQPARFVEEFERYNENYRPDTLGATPRICVDKARFDDYYDLGIESCGVAAEADRVAEILAAKGAVTIVDGTDYHPELYSEHSTKPKESDEIWGAYTPPQDRVLNAFAGRLMEGRVHLDLRHNSFLTAERDNQFEDFIKMVAGVDVDVRPSLKDINRMISELSCFDDNLIMVVDASSVRDLEEFKRFVDLLEQHGIKIIIRARESIPGIASVTIEPFRADNLTARLAEEAEILEERLELDSPLTPKTLEFLCKQVATYRRPSQDPLNLALQTLRLAAQTARMDGTGVIERADIVEALAPIFHLPNPEQTAKRVKAVESFAETAKLTILGQDDAIDRTAELMENHLMGLLDPESPLTITFPGPTGVGKTLLASKLAKDVDLPFFGIDGGQFTEQHAIAKLIGSPSGYKGPDVGSLVRFVTNNPNGVIFLDEWEKMHPEVIQALMNLMDKGELTDGQGNKIVRPGLTIILATNAGQHKLKRGMDEQEVKDVITEALAQKSYGVEQPEIITRSEVIPMLAIEKDGFRKAISRHLDSLKDRPGVIRANIEITDIDQDAAELVFRNSQEVCRLKKQQAFAGFKGKDGTTVELGEIFNDLRMLPRIIGRLALKSINSVVKDTYTSGRAKKGQPPRKMRLVKDEAGKLVLKDAA